MPAVRGTCTLTGDPISHAPWGIVQSGRITNKSRHHEVVSYQSTRWGRDRSNAPHRIGKEGHGLPSEVVTAALRVCAASATFFHCKMPRAIFVDASFYGDRQGRGKSSGNLETCLTCVMAEGFQSEEGADDRLRNKLQYR